MPDPHTQIHRKYCPCAFHKPLEPVITPQPTCVAVLDHEILDVLPLILGHLPLQAVGHLRQTCRLLRTSPCILAVATHAGDCHLHPCSELLDHCGGLKFILSLPHLSSMRIRETNSLFGLHCLQQLQRLTLRSPDGLDFRPLTELPALRSLDVHFSSPGSGHFLEELTQLTALSFRGYSPGKVAHLTNLRKLAMHEIFDDAFPLQHLSRLTELTGPVELLDARLGQLPLLRLHITSDHAVWLENKLGNLSHARSLTALTLQSSPTQGSRDIDLSELNALPHLQALRLLFCFPDGALSFPAMTSLSIQSGDNACRLPDVRHCQSLQLYTIFMTSGNFVVSADQLPPFSRAQPLIIRHASRSSGCLVLHNNLIQQHRLREGLSLEEWKGEWWIYETFH